MSTQTEISVNDISKLLDVSSSRARAIMAKLVTRGILDITGGNRNRLYKMKA